jgi:hypothetical protein
MHKHGRNLAFLQCLFQALRKFIKPRTYKSAELKTSAVAYLKGVWSTRKDKGRYAPTR